MAKVCGIELKSSEAILAVLECVGSDCRYISVEPKRIQIGNDEVSAEISSFYETFCNFLRDNRIEQVVVKKRAKRGNYAGGAVSFKLEALIQLNPVARVSFISGQAIAAAQRRSAIEIPSDLNRYQEQAFLVALVQVLD